MKNLILSFAFAAVIAALGLNVAEKASAMGTQGCNTACCTPSGGGSQGTCTAGCYCYYDVNPCDSCSQPSAGGGECSAF